MKAEKIGINKKTLPILIICFTIGIIFLILSEYSGFEKTKGEEVFDEKAYTSELETRLEAILNQMDGIEHATVMITLESGLQHDYASQITKNANKDSSSLETYLEMSADGGKSQPVIKTTLLPKIRGASAVCQGAANPEVQRKIIRLLASTLNLNENQIFVTE